MDTIDAVSALLQPTGLPWVADIARRMEALAARGEQPGAAEFAQALHAQHNVGMLVLQLAVALDKREREIHAEEARIDAKTAHLEALLRAAGEVSGDLLTMIESAEDRRAGLLRALDRR